MTKEEFRTKLDELGLKPDALGKLAQMLGIPTRGLWDKVPGVTDQDLARWEVLQVEDTRRAANAQAASIGMIVDDGASDAPANA